MPSLTVPYQGEKYSTEASLIIPQRHLSALPWNKSKTYCIMYPILLQFCLDKSVTNTPSEEMMEEIHSQQSGPHVIYFLVVKET